MIKNYLIILLLCYSVEGANWAQVGGATKTKTTIVEDTPWTARWGHNVAALDYTAEYMNRTGQRARLFIIGGEDQMQTDELNEDDLKPYPGGGGYKNDVWSTTGYEWEVQQNPLKTTKWGDPLPQIIAKISWNQNNKGRQPPRGVPYDEWIACATAPWTVTKPVGDCTDRNTAPGMFLADIMFSPRRNFVSLTFNNAIYVMGGRARELMQLPYEESRGGIIGPRMPRWREKSVLKNDVWKSTDAGGSWTLVSPGCKMPQASLIHTSGAQEFQCKDDSDCDGASSCYVENQNLGLGENGSIGKCVCNVWSAREHHAASVHNGFIYVSGGYTFLRLSNCGAEHYEETRPSGAEYACGGGYRGVMDDLWKSPDGANWERIKLSSAFEARGEHAMASLHNVLYLIGGRMGGVLASTHDAADEAILLNDVWESRDNGVSWAVTTHSAPWSARAKHRVVVVPKEVAVSIDEAFLENKVEEPLELQMLLMAGEDDEDYLQDVWTWDGKSEWKMDYDTDTSFKDFVSAPIASASITEALSHVISREERESLAAEGITTLSELRDISLDSVLNLRSVTNVVPKICDYKELASAVITQCSLTEDEYDGMEFENVEVIQGQFGEQNAAAAAAAAAANVGTSWDGCQHYGSQVYDEESRKWIWPHVNGHEQVEYIRLPFETSQAILCKSRPEARASFGLSLFQGKVFVLGGKSGKMDFDNDVWYRDSVRPTASFSTVPAPFTSETVFKFLANEPGCIFQYHVYNTIEQLVVRNWTYTLGEFDFLPWLDGGMHRLRIRAIDPAGNTDEIFIEGINEYTWVYVPVLPWGLIIGLSVTFFLMMVGVLIEWRRRRKKAAMERYAMKRMRRKLKNKKKGGANKDVDWRKDYDKGKKGGKKKKKKSKDKDKKKDKKSKDKKSKDKKKDKKKGSDKKSKVKPLKDKKSKKSSSSDKKSKKSKDKKKKKRE